MPVFVEEGPNGMEAVLVYLISEIVSYEGVDGHSDSETRQDNKRRRHFDAVSDGEAEVDAIENEKRDHDESPDDAMKLPPLERDASLKPLDWMIRLFLILHRYVQSSWTIDEDDLFASWRESGCWISSLHHLLLWHLALV